MTSPQLGEHNEGKVLVVDDDANMRRVLKTTLRPMGFTVVEAARGEEAVSLVRVNQFDAVLLDINFPGMGGVEACRAMRKSIPDLPILMLTVRGAEDDKVLALNSGADDYITKPFQLRETVARIRASIRRRRCAPNELAPIRSGEIELDYEKHRVTKRGKPIRLTPKEFELLRHLMLHVGKPVMHSRLLKAVWGPEYGSELEYLRTFVRNLRKKIEDDPANPRYLLTDSYLGYRFDQPPRDA